MLLFFKNNFIFSVINDKISDEAGNTGSDFSPGTDHADFVGQTILSTERLPVEVTIESDMIRVLGQNEEIQICHHFNTISISMCDSTISNIFCYLANGTIRTKNQKFETVGNPHRQLYIFQCASIRQAREMARAMDRKFKPRSYKQNLSGPCRSYLAPVGGDKVRIPQEALVSVRH